MVFIALTLAGCAFNGGGRTPRPLILPRPGIILTEGANISGVFNWGGSTSMAIEYNYTFRAPTSASPGLLEMQFDLVRGEEFSELFITLYIADNSNRVIAAERLFDRHRRVTLTGTHREMAIDPYTAYSFLFFGGGYIEQGSRNVFRDLTF